MEEPVRSMECGVSAAHSQGSSLMNKYNHRILDAYSVLESLTANEQVAGVAESHWWLAHGWEPY